MQVREVKEMLLNVSVKRGLVRFNGGGFSCSVFLRIKVADLQLPFTLTIERGLWDVMSQAKKGGQKNDCLLTRNKLENRGSLTNSEDRESILCL